MNRRLVFSIALLQALPTAWAQSPATGATTTTVTAPSAATAAPRTSASTAFETLGNDYWETEMRLSPLWATFINYPGQNGKLDDVGASGREREKAELGALLARLGAIDRAGLSEDERVSADIMRLQIEDKLDWHAHRFYEWGVDHMDGPQSWIATVMETAQPAATAADAEDTIARLKAMPAFFQNEIANLKEGLADDRVAARVPVEKTIRQIRELLASPTAELPFASPLKRMPKELKAKYEAPVLAAIDASARPALEGYAAFLEKDYLPHARGMDKPGLVWLPGGKEAYRHAIRSHTTLDKTPEELHQAGLDELKGIHEEMEAVAKRLGKGGDLKAFTHWVTGTPDHYFTTREEVRTAAEALVAKLSAKLPDYFGTLPKTPLVVKPVEAFQEKNEAAARYFEPPDDLSRPGIYYINTYQPNTRPRFGMASLAAHEGVPGHHLQIAIALEKRGLPAYRRHAEFTSFVEGWALYSERLADEMGFYKDDLDRVGMLSDQALRACRLVVDTGLHAMGWSRQKAIDFMKDNAPMSDEEIETEVDRYIVWPGQALAYKVGQREISALRRESQAKLGDKFDLKAFHDAVLRNGAVPLPTLRRIVLGTN